MIKGKKRILAISGSTKSGSSVHAILKYIGKAHADTLEFVVYDRIGTLPHFNPEVDDEHLASEVKELRAEIEKADGVLFCTPEYVFSLPGSLKNAIEWHVSTVLFSNKPVAIIVAAALGAKALESLFLIMTTIEAAIADDSKLILNGMKRNIKNDELVDVVVQGRIDKVVYSLIATIENEKRQPTKYMEDTKNII